MSAILREHCEHNREHALTPTSHLHGEQLLDWHDRDHEHFAVRDRADHPHDINLRVEILEIRTARLERRLTGVIDTHSLWDGS